MASLGHLPPPQVPLWFRSDDGVRSPTDSPLSESVLFCSGVVCPGSLCPSMLMNFLLTCLRSPGDNHSEGADTPPLSFRVSLRRALRPSFRLSRSTRVVILLLCFFLIAPVPWRALKFRRETRPPPPVFFFFFSSTQPAPSRSNQFLFFHDHFSGVVYLCSLTVGSSSLLFVPKLRGRSARPLVSLIFSPHKPISCKVPPFFSTHQKLPPPTWDGLGFSAFFSHPV